MSEATGDHKARPGVVAVPQTFGSVLNVHPHAHCLASRGVWDEKGQWLPVPYIDTNVAEKLFAHKIFRLLKSKDLLSDARMNLLLSFRNSGFSVDTSPTVWPQDTQGLERLCRYLLRCPVSLSRIHWTPGSKTLFYESKGSHDDTLLSHPQGESLDIFEFIARVLTQIFAVGRPSKGPRNISYPRRSPNADDSEPRKHGVHYFGAYASRTLVFQKKHGISLQSLGDNNSSKSKTEPELSPKKARRSQKKLGAAHQTGLSSRSFEM